MNSKLIKEDINFLEFPIWIIAKRTAKKQIIIEKNNGIYKISTSLDSLPCRVDKLILYYFLWKLWKESKFKSTKTIAIRYQAAIDIFDLNYKPSNHHYKKIMDSLEKWTNVNISFKGIFYEGDSYTTRFFGIIDDVILDENTKKLYIKFNEQYIKQLEETKFYKYIDYNEYKKLKRPVSARLYEILIKTFKDRNIWQIAIIKLAEKLTLSEIFASQILKKLTPAITEININTELHINLEYDQETKICTFTKWDMVDKQKNNINKKIKESDIILTPIGKEISEILKIPKDRISELIDKYGIDRITAVFNHVRADKALKNPAGFFIKAIEEEYKIVTLEDPELFEIISQLKTEAAKCYMINNGNCGAEFNESKLDKYNKACYWCKRFEKNRESDLEDKPEYSREEMENLKKEQTEKFNFKIIENNPLKNYTKKKAVQSTEKKKQ